MGALKNLTTGAVLSSNVSLAGTFWQRTVGFLGREAIAPDEGIWIAQCSAVHTMGMRTAIDIIFLDRHSYVMRIVRSVKPNVSQIACPLAYAVVETGASCDLGHDLLVGDQLALQ